MNVPRSSLAVIHSINQIFRADGVSSHIQPVISLCSSCGIIGIYQIVGFLDFVNPVLVRKLAAKSLNDKVNWHLIGLVGFAILKIVGICVLGKILIKLHGYHSLTSRIQLVANRG